MTKFFRLVAAAATVLALAACSEEAPGSTAPEASSGEAAAVADTGGEQLKGRYFVLETVDGQPAVFPDRQPALEFDQDLRMTGQVCNRFMGAPRFEGGQLIAEVAATRMLCIDDKLNALEDRFYQALARGTAVVFDGQNLVLKNADGEFVFRSAPAPAEP